MKRKAFRWLEIVLVVLVLTLVGILVNNLAVNLIRTGLGLSFEWLWQPAGFALSEHTSALQEGLKFTNITRPMVVADDRHRGR